MAERKRIVIIGAGFGGLWAARSLTGAPVEVFLLDRNNYHVFFPLLYQAGAAELEPEDIAYPVRTIFRKAPNIHLRMADVRSVDLHAKLIAADGWELSYDYLILALGSTTNYFGVPGADQHAFPLRTLEDGVALRNHILSCFELAAGEPDAQRRERLLTFAIVGGGPTGVEFAGALTELIYGPLAKDFKSLDLNTSRVVLIEATDSLLPSFPKRLASYALKRLCSLRTEVHLESVVSQVEPGVVHLKEGSAIPTETVIWTAGVAGDSLVRHWGLPIGRAGRVAVLPTLQVPQHPNVYVVGDLAYFEEKGQPLPMVAPVAVQQGEKAARNILRQISGQQPLPFHYKDLGTMAVIGRSVAVANLFGRLGFTGFPAWVMWLSIHLFKLIGFRNRLLVLTSWAWDYVFYERVVRLILRSKKE